MMTHSNFIGFLINIKGETIGIANPIIPTSNQDGAIEINIPNLPTSDLHTDSVFNNTEEFEDESSSNPNEDIINKGKLFFSIFSVIFYVLLLINYIQSQILMQPSNKNPLMMIMNIIKNIILSLVVLMFQIMASVSL